MARLSFRCDEGLVKRVDEARGEVARERWLRGVVEQALEASQVVAVSPDASQRAGQTSALLGDASRAAESLSAPSAPAEQPPVVAPVVEPPARPLSRVEAFRRATQR